MPDAITAQCLIMREGSTNIDYFNLVLHYPDKVATLHSYLYSAGPNKRFSVKGDKGSYEKQGLDPQEDRLKAGGLPTEPSWADVSALTRLINYNKCITFIINEHHVWWIYRISLWKISDLFIPAYKALVLFLVLFLSMI